MPDPVLDATDLLDDASSGLLGLLLLVGSTQDDIEPEPLCTLLRLVYDRLQAARAGMAAIHHTD